MTTQDVIVQHVSLLAVHSGTAESPIPVAWTHFRLGIVSMCPTKVSGMAAQWQKTFQHSWEKTLRPRTRFWVADDRGVPSQPRRTWRRTELGLLLCLARHPRAVGGKGVAGHPEPLRHLGLRRRLWCFRNNSAISAISLSTTFFPSPIHK